jgi:hypothetical protein
MEMIDLDAWVRAQVSDGIARSALISPWPARTPPHPSQSLRIATA